MKKKQAASFKGLFSSDYEKWIPMEARLLATNNYGSWASVEEANANVDKAIQELSETIKSGVEEEVRRLVDEERDDLIEAMTENIVAGPDLPKMGPSDENMPLKPGEARRVSMKHVLRRAKRNASKRETDIPYVRRSRKIAQDFENWYDVKEIQYKKYGPGKFSDNIEEFVYRAAMEGFGDTLGDEGFGVYDLVTFDQPIKVIQNGNDWEFAAAIIYYMDSGFVDVEYYDTVAEAEEAWEKLEMEYEEHMAEYGEEEDW